MRLDARDADRLEEVGLRRTRLAALDQLEQGDERRRLGAALEARDLVVEDEAAAGAHEQPEALDERPHRDGAPADHRRVDALAAARAGAASPRPGARAARPRAAPAGRGGAYGAGVVRNTRRPGGGAALGEPVGRALEALVLGEALRELLGRGLGVELLLVVGLGVDEQARLELAERGDEHEELRERLEVDLLGALELGQVGQDDVDDRHLDQLELLAQDEGEQEVERAREGVEVEVELENGSVHARIVATTPDALRGFASTAPQTSWASPPSTRTSLKKSAVGRTL